VVFMNKMTVQRRVVIWLSAISSVTLITLVCIGWEVRDTIRTNGLTRINKILEHKIESIDMYAHQRYIALNNLKQLVFFAAHHHPIFEKKFWDNPPQSLSDSMASFADQNGFYDLFIINLDGDIVYTVKHESDLHTNLVYGEYRQTELAYVFNGALKNAKPNISDYDFYVPSNDFAAFIAEPIVDNGKTIGVVAVQMDNKKIQHVINDYSELGKTGEVIAAFRHNGKLMVAAPVRHSDIEAFNSSDSLRLTSLFDSLKGKSGQLYMHGRTGNDAAAAWGYQDDFRMNIVATIDQNELLEMWYRQFTTILLLFLIGVSVIVSMLYVLFRSFAKPIAALTKYASEISEGKYNREIISEDYDLEWQVLIRSFDNMSIDINQKITQLNQQNILLSDQKGKIEELNQSLEAKIKLKSKQLNAYIDIIDQYVITSQTDREGSITYVSEAFCNISGYTKEELIGENHRIVRHPDMPNEMFESMWKTISSGHIWHGEIKNRTASGGYYWVDMTISPNVEDGAITGYTAVRQDITDKKIIEELAITDSMTGLYNRRYYVKIIKEEMNRVKRHHSSMALMMIDVDNFKLYNDTYGHQAGDIVLNKVAEVLKFYTSRSGEYAFRLGGEEFGIVVSSMSSEEYLDLGNRIRGAVEALEIPHEKNNAALYVTISVGIAVYHPVSGSDMTCEELYRLADAQLYIAKDGGRNHVDIKPFL